jgi:signal transduction histidine kinase
VRVTRASDRTLELCIEDNGHGNVVPASGGFGLVGMRERVEALGGALSVEGRPGVGTRLHATIPLPLH